MTLAIKPKFSKDFISKFAEITAGYFSEIEFEKLISLFENKITSPVINKSTESNLIRIFSSLFDKYYFFKDCFLYPHYSEIILKTTNSSNYLTDIIVRNPENLYLILDTNRLQKKIDENIFADEVMKSISSLKTLQSKVNLLKYIKRKEILLIGVQDILGIFSFKEIIESLSIIAKVLTAQLFVLCYEEILSKNKIKKIKNKFCLISLGKLGGYELNYSSDIDLMIFYDKNIKYSSKEYFELLNETVLLFIEKSSQVTDNGFLFRIDFRLRPDGKNSPLCRTITDILHYYECRGEDWERQMLLKMNLVCGDENLFTQFKNYLAPFIFPQSFNLSPTEQIKRLRKNVTRNLSNNRDIKLSAGGIRDIEFSVQAMQLLHGGTNKNLRTGNTLIAIEKLCNYKLLNNFEKNIFTEAYIFYRKIEHFLQLMNDSQTHTIPTEGEILEKLFWFLGFNNLHNFENQLKNFKADVVKIFNSIINLEMDSGEKIDFYTAINFNDKSQAMKNYFYLKEGIGILGQKQFDSKTVNSFLLIEDELRKYLQDCNNPDLVLNNFVRVIKTSRFPSIWYEEFKNKKTFSSFLTICELSQKCIELFAEDKSLRDNFLSGKVFEKLISSKLKYLSVKELYFILSIQLALRIINAKDASTILSIYFNQKIESLTKEFNTNKNYKNKFCIVSLGSIASQQMTFGSDIDLIFVSDKIENQTNIQNDFAGLLIKIKSNLSPVEIDCRLRPEGKSSNIIWEIGAYKKYLETRARIWELQTFCKMNFIFGSKKIFNKLITHIENRIQQETTDKIKTEILEMRKKLNPAYISNMTSVFNLKKSSGGILDIEFLIQFLILSKPNLFLTCRGKNILEVIEILYSKRKIISNDKNALLKNYFFLKNLEFVIQNIFNKDTASISFDKIDLQTISKAMNFKNTSELKDVFEEATKSNKNLFNKYLA